MKHSGMMALVNAYKEEMEKRYQDKLNRSFRFCEQWYIDQALICAERIFNADPDKLREFCTEMEKHRNEFVNEIWNKDTKDVEYSMTILDRELEPICGKFFAPFEKRYEDRIWLLREVGK